MTFAVRIHQLLGDFRLFGAAGGDLDAFCIARHTLREVADNAFQRGREEQGLAGVRSAFDDRLDVLDEAHVQHAIGLVEHQHFDFRQVDAAAVKVIEQATGCCDHDVHTDAQQACFQMHGRAAHDADVAQLAQEFSIGVRGTRDLCCQFACWR